MLVATPKGQGSIAKHEIAGEAAMLVLTRKVGEEIIINGEIRVSVVLVRGNRVRIGIKAPTNVRIQRQELAVPASGQRQVPIAAGCLR
jgi:carbon storage regulator